jgi:type I restriction enzyme S subunit
MELMSQTKRSEVGVIPVEWDCLEFVAVSDLITCGIAATPTYVSEGQGYPFLSSTNIKGGRIRWQSFKYISSTLHKQLFRNNPPLKGDILYSRVGTIGEAAVVDVEFQFSIYVSLTLIKPKKCLNSSFLAHLLNSDAYKNRARDQVYLGGGVGNLNVDVVRKYPIVLPPISEQEAIAEALTDADALIESLEQLLAKKRLLKQGAMQELLRPKSSDTVKELREVSSLKGRIGWQGLKQAEFTTNADEPFLITGMNFKDGAIRWDEVYHISENRYEIAPEIQLRKDDVLMTKDGTIGKLLYIDTIPAPGKASLNSHLLLLRPVRESYNPRYLYYQLCSERFRDFVELNKTGTTFFGLSQAAVGRYPLVLPSMEVQAEIASTLADMDAEITALEAKLTKARCLKQAMMQELLTGRIRLVPPVDQSEATGSSV